MCTDKISPRWNQTKTPMAFHRKKSLGCVPRKPVTELLWFQQSNLVDLGHLVGWKHSFLSLSGPVFLALKSSQQRSPCQHWEAILPFPQMLFVCEHARLMTTSVEGWSFLIRLPLSRAASDTLHMQSWDRARHMSTPEIINDNLCPWFLADWYCFTCGWHKYSQQTYSPSWHTSEFNDPLAGSKVHRRDFTLAQVWLIHEQGGLLKTKRRC